MSINLIGEIVSSKEACVTWYIPVVLSYNEAKATLFLSDVNQTSTNTFSIVKYQIRSNEFVHGSHTFTNLQPGNYVAKIFVIDNNSDVFEAFTNEIKVFNLDAPQFNETTPYVPASKKITIDLASRGSLDNNELTSMELGKVTFILFGQYISGDITQASSAGAFNVILPYNGLTNTYVIEHPSMENNVEYELSCFYTNKDKCASELSNSIIVRPSNLPNKITQLEPLYNSVSQTLTIIHNMPNNLSEYVPEHCRATITDISNLSNPVKYYISSENSANLSPAPTPSDPIVFNLDNQTLLPIDKVFTITLAIKNSFGYGEESSPIYCINPQNYSSKSVLNENLIFSLTPENYLEIADNVNNLYVENTNYTVRYVANVFECLVNGSIDITKDPINIDPTNSRPNGIYNLSTFNLGTLYKYILNVYYDKTFDDETIVTINPHVEDVCYYYFIPHNAPNPVTLSAVPDNESVTVSWDDLTLAELNGYKLDHYEYYIDAISTEWTSVNKNITHTFNNLTNGIRYTFNIRSVSYSDNTLYNNNDRTESNFSSITFIPFGKALVPILDERIPEDGKSTIVFYLPEDPYNGGDFDQFEASIDSGDFNIIVPTVVYDSNRNITTYTNVFNNLSNNLHTIQIRIKTQNKTNATFKKYSNALEVTTIPFSKPTLPTNFTAKPYTVSVDLYWNEAVPNSIIQNLVKYEVSYKESDSPVDTPYTVTPTPITFDTIPITLANFSVLNLNFNTSYDFKIRSMVYNNELNRTVYSDAYSTIITSKTFKYLNPPVMNLVAGQSGSRIDVELSPNSDNFYNNKFNYYATIYEISDTLKQHPKTTYSYGVTTTATQTLTLNTFNNSDAVVPDNNQALIDFSLYVIESYYEMFNPETETYYRSNTVTNQTYPFDPEKAPVLSAIAGNQSVTLSWTSTDLNAVTVTNYELSSNSENWSPIVYQQVGNVFSTTISSLTNGEVYYYYVRAIIDTDKYSVASNMVTTSPYTTPSAPNVSTQVSSQTIDVTWSLTNTGGLSQYYYQIKIDYTDSENNLVQGELINKDKDTLTHTFNNLTNGQLYIIYVIIVGEVIYENNKLVYGDVAFSPTLVYSNAIAPANFVTVSYPLTIEDNVRLTWDLPSDLGGLVLDHYEVTPNVLEGTIVEVENGTSYDYDYANDVNFQNTPGVGGNTNDDNSITLNGQRMRIGKKWWNFAVRVVTKKPDGTKIYGDWAYSLNAACKKPRKPTEMSVVKTHNHQQVELSDTNGILYMLMPLSWNNDDGATLWEGIGVSENYRFAYEVSSNEGVNWVSPSRKDNGTIISSEDGIGGLHVWGCIEQSLTPTTYINDNQTITQYTFTADGSIIVGQEYKFCIRRVGYNLFNPDSTVAVYSDVSDIVLNTSYHVTPQYHYYDLPSAVYLANPLLGVTSTPSDGKINLTWDAANSSVLRGLTLNYYEVQLDEGNWTKVNNDTSITNYEFSGLTNGTEYTISVRTNCSHSERNISGTTITKVFTGTPVSLYNVPYVKASAPVNLVKSYPDSQEVKIVWDAVTGFDLGGLSLKKYQVSSDGTTWTDVASSSSEYTFTGLTNGASYTISVRAVTMYNDATPDTVVLFDFTDIKGTVGSISVIPRARPVAPTEVSIVQGNSELTYAWNYNTSTPGLISFSTFNGAVGSADLIDSITTESVAYSNLGGNNYSFGFSGLTNGVKYNIKIVPVLIISSTSELIEGTPLTSRSFVPYVKASAPTSLITTPGDKQIKLEWSPVDNLGGLSLQKYQVSKDNGTNWTDVASSSREYTFTELTNGTNYNMNVRAITEFIDANPIVSFQNIEGTSETKSAIPFVNPGYVTGITTSVINSVLTFTFIPPTSVNGDITQYYQYSIDDGFNWTLVDLNAPWPNVNVGDNRFVLRFRVYILNPNATINAVYGDTVTLMGLKSINITTPENLKATVGNGTVTLSWNLIGRMTYQVIKYVSPSPIVDIITNMSTYTFDGLQNGIEYSFGVSTFYNSIEGPVANISAIPMTKPYNVQVSKLGGTLVINLNYGGSDKVYVNLTAQQAVVIDGEDYVVLDSTMKVSFETSANPITYTVDNRNYFDITISNSIGTVTGIFRI